MAEFVQWAKECGVDPIEAVVRYLKLAALESISKKLKQPSKERLTKEELTAIKGGAKVRRLRSSPKKG